METGIESVSVYVSDYEKFIVRFVGDKAIQVDQVRAVWVASRGAPSQMMNQRIEKAIKDARAARNEPQSETAHAKRVELSKREGDYISRPRRKPLP